MQGARRSAMIGPVLVLATLVSSIISSFGAPLIPTIARDFHESLSTAQWSLTVALLVGTISSPVLGRLGDGPRQRATMLTSLTIVTVGGAVAAFAAGAGVFGLLILGRGLQGVGLALAPIAMATARDAMPSAEARSMVALLSVSSAAGLGAGYPISGLIAGSWGLSGAYWFGAIVSGVTVVCVAAVIPSSTHGPHTAHRFDWVGIVLLGSALLCGLVAASQGPEQGWGTPAIIGLLIGGVVMFAVWAVQQLRVENPLVQLRLLRHPAVLSGDACALMLGVAMYMTLTGVTVFVQSPRSGGFGFSVSALVAGLVLIPLSFFMLISSRALPTLVARMGDRAVLALGCLTAALGCGFFGLFHDSLWQAFVMTGILGVGLGATFAAIPGLIAQAVPGQETGSAIGFYQVLRFIGYATGSTLTATVLAACLGANGQPSADGYTTVLWISMAICVLAAALAWFLHAQSARLAPMDHRSPPMRGTIVVGVDGSPSSVCALRIAGSLSVALNARLRIVTTWQIPSSAEDVYGSEVDNDAGLAAKVQHDALREAFGNRLPDNSESVVAEGDSASILIEEGNTASMIVVGSRGHATVVGLLTGSVSAACAEHARCPVLVVH